MKKRNKLEVTIKAIKEIEASEQSEMMALIFTKDVRAYMKFDSSL